MKKIALFIDFENLRLNFFERAYKEKKFRFDYNSMPEKVVEFCTALLENNKEEIYRIFFYTAKPSSTHPRYNDIHNFFDKLEKLNHVALRQGKLVARGRAPNVTYVQKQVDMLLGLDIADVSIKHHADTVLLFGYDSDMAPALKLARVNGLQAEIVKFTDLSPRIEASLQKHCDRTREFKIEDIYRQIGIIV